MCVKSASKLDFDKINTRFESVKTNYESLRIIYSQLAWILPFEAFWDERLTLIKPVLLLEAKTETEIQKLKHEVLKDTSMSDLRLQIISLLNNLLKKSKDLINVFNPFRKSWDDKILNTLEKRFPKPVENDQQSPKIEYHLVRQMMAKCGELKLLTPAAYTDSITDI